MSTKAINEEMNSHIRNLFEDINIITRVIKDIKFVYCCRMANSLQDMMAKKALLSCN